MNNKVKVNKKKTCAFYTFGCKVNQYETQVIREQFENNGFTETKDDPEYYIINGCTVTAQADRKCRYLVNSLHKKNPKAKIILTGCFAQNHPDIKKSIKGITRLVPQDKKTAVFSFADADDSQYISDFKGHSRAFVKIQDGCDCFCSYCIVPHMRGKPRSRSRADIIREIKKLTAKGFKEIVLTGINLGLWQEKKDNRQQTLPDLLYDLVRIKDLRRLRLSSIELVHVDDRLIEVFKRSKKICRHLHIPLQSGDDLILKKMNRRYDSRAFLNILKKTRAAVKDLNFTTDIMVGFPGETDDNFNNTLEFVKKAGFLRVHVFPFSPRPKTKAAQMPGQVDTATKNNRKKTLAQACEDISYSLRKKLLGKYLSVLFEQKTTDGGFTGYSDSYVSVKAGSEEDLQNTIRDIRVVKVTRSQTIGKIDNRRS